MRTVSHMIRTTVITAIVAAGLVVAAGIAVNGALAIVVGLIALVALAMIWPLEAILYDERRPPHLPL